MGPKIKESIYGPQPGNSWIAQGNWASVISSNVSAIRYERSTGRLWVEFSRKGRTQLYYYQNVPEGIAQGMYYCNSMGKFVHWLEKNGWHGVKGMFS